MKRSARWHSSLLLIFCFALTGAADASDDPPLEGVVSDRTVTPKGRAIFIAFLRGWQAQEIRPLANLTVQEQPAARGGTEIAIASDQRVLFRSRVSGSRTDPELMARAALTTVARQLAADGTLSYAELSAHDELR